MKEVGEGRGGWPVHRLRMKTALFSGLFHPGPQSAGAAQGATGTEETSRAGLGARRCQFSAPSDAGRPTPRCRSAPSLWARVASAGSARAQAPPPPAPPHAHTRSRSRRWSRKEARSESEQPLVKEKDMHRQLGNLRRWRRAGRARRIPGS